MATFGVDMYATKTLVQGLGEEFSIPAAWSDDDVDAAIVRMSRVIDQVTRNYFGKRDMVLELDGSGGPKLFLNQRIRWPIVTVTSVKWREDYAGVYDNTLASDKYRISRSRKCLERVDAGWFDDGHENWQVSGSFGRANVPEIIQWACVLLVREHITPGSADKYEKLVTERFPSGYSYSRKSGGGTQDSAVAALGGKTTGVAVVDNLLVTMKNPMVLLSVVR